jgi:hypothetical protein
LGHTAGCGRVEHFVQDQWKFVAKNFVLAPSFQKRGFSGPVIRQGKMTITRLICSNCIRKQDEIDELKRHVRKVALEAEGVPSMNMYQILAS